MSAMGEVNRVELEIRSNPVMAVMPLVLVIFAVAWGAMASLIPIMLGRIVAWAGIVGVLSYMYLTTIRRLVVGENTVDIELSRKMTCITYSNLDHVTVRAVHLGGMVSVKFVTKDPPRAIRGRIGLTSYEVLKIAPQLIETLLRHGVDVRVPGRPDVGTGWP